jgi:hypothetical protein
MAAQFVFLLPCTIVLELASNCCCLCESLVCGDSGVLIQPSLYSSPHCVLKPCMQDYCSLDLLPEQKPAY